jgi:hypothetical protein
MVSYLKSVSQALHPGGRFVIQTPMAAESILPNLEERAWSEVGDILILVENQYLVEESCLETGYNFIFDGNLEKRTSYNWIFTVAEIKQMLAESGFETLEMFGSLDRKPFEFNSSELIVVAEKTFDNIG